jgi:hypothetical protein
MRPRLTYANVMATVAVFIALGGSAYAFHLGKNSVGSKQLKKNAVVTAKVKNEAITAAKVKRGALTGTQIDASTLGTVPTADQARTADEANGLAPAEDWHEVGGPGQPEFLNSWRQGAGPGGLAFYRDHEGVVHLKGAALEGEPSTPIFQLPPGYRPTRRTAQTIPVACSPCSVGETGVVLIEGPDFPGGVDGAVVAPEGATIAVSLDGAAFRAES